MRCYAALASLLVWLLACNLARAGTATAPNVTVEYDGIDQAQAEAIASTLSAARQVYADDFGFDMPDRITCSVKCAPGNPTRLWTDGEDHVNLTLPNKSKLDRPARSGVYNLYGMCHELGHVAMYRILKKRDWLAGGAAEAWAHYAGSVVVDGLYEMKSEKLWADPYDYRQDGTARLAKQLSSESPDAQARAAGEWQKLDWIVGHKGLPKVFVAWETATVDPADPAPALGKALAGAAEAEKAAALKQWWQLASPLLVRSVKPSSFTNATIAPSQLTGKPQTIAEDDDQADGHRSIAGGGHARLFKTPDEGEYYAVAVWVHGQRYGPPRAPQTQFDVAICDKDLKPITTVKKPYSLFPYGKADWVRVPIPPTRVPAEFAACVVFRPTATNGVYVSFDSSKQGGSFVATPGDAQPREFDQGVWMLRVEVDRKK